MEPERKYLVVGVFVVTLVLGILGFAIWMIGQSTEGHYETYQTFVSESVNGLSVGSAVKYRGVDVGRVSYIGISRSNPAKIRIEMQILDNTPITTSTVAVLQLQGITGMAYIELKGRVAKGQPKIGLIGQNRIPIIRSAPSEFRQIVDSVPAMLQKFTELADKLNNFASPENQTRFATILTNMEAFSHDVGNTGTNGQTLVDDIRMATQQLGEAATTINRIASGSADETRLILENALKTVEKLNSLASKADRYSGKSYQEISALVLEVKRTARDIRNLSQSLKENPSQLIFPAQHHGVTVPSR